MNRKIITGVLFLLGVAGIAGLAYLLRDATIPVLDPKGIIAEQQRDLIIVTTLLMLLVVLPVFGLTFFIAWRYRAGNTAAKYQPEWDHSSRAEAIWWGFPLLIIAVLAVVIWKSSHDLDPYRPLDSEVRPVTVQVVALQWKWLFIYPEYGIATVNYVQFPEDRPVNFRITADAPMNSFWIPRLGGQMYAMSGMKTKLHLMANEPGVYDGYSANFSGEGFAKMTFKAEATSDEAFAAWVKSVKDNRQTLDAREYANLAKPSTQERPSAYGSTDGKLYDTIVMKYMQPVSDVQTSEEGGAHGRH